MRDTKRISILLKLLEKRWNQSPDQRLGQLLINLNHELGGNSDVWHTEDDLFIALLEKQIKPKEDIHTSDEPIWVVFPV